MLLVLLLTYILSLLFVIVEIIVMCHTHINIYFVYTSGKIELESSYDFHLKVWHLIVIVLLWIVPYINVIAVLAALSYIIKSYNITDLTREYGYTTVYSTINDTSNICKIINKILTSFTKTLF